ncbi:hypothetical protein ACVWZE_005678, partial [Pseudomonas chlororaphis]
MYTVQKSGARADAIASKLRSYRCPPPASGRERRNGYVNVQKVQC